MKENEKWLEEALPLYSSLTQSVVTITERLLRTNNIPFLSVTGRTKDKKSTLEKIERKGYKKPTEQLTDLSGIRIILYSETDVDNVSQIISNSFNLDKENSSNKDDLLAKNEIGYRSIHMVSDLGKERTKLPEFMQFKNMKFEFQIRTVLQHAWAELSHDRNYKFNKKLPKKLERKLYLYAGMLEIVDNGLDELSNNIDEYILEQAENIKDGNFKQSIDSLNLQEFIKNWSKENNLELLIIDDLNELIYELKQFNIQTIEQLNNIIPEGYVAKYKSFYDDNQYSMIGIIRDWMIINDYKKYANEVTFNWVMNTSEEKLLESYFKKVDWENIIQIFDETNEFENENIDDFVELEDDV